MAKKSARAQWQAWLTGGDTSRPAWPSSEALCLNNRFTGVVLGIDPSLRGTGLAVLNIRDRQKPVLLSSQTVSIAISSPMPACLGQIAKAVTQVLDRYPIDHVAVEQTIYVQNFQTAQVLGAARGAAIATAAGREHPVHEYPPLRIKQAVVGYGRAGKEQLAKTVQGLLKLRKSLPWDEADAAAVALCHAFTFCQ